MERTRRDRLDIVQNLVIVLLSVSAVFLFTRTDLFHLGLDFITRRFLDGETASADTVFELRAASAPVRIAVTGDYGHYASVTLTTDVEEFDLPGKLLREALGSAREFTVCTEEEVCAALGSSSVYFDFIDPLPLSYLAAVSGGSCDRQDDARCVVIAEKDGAVVLYLWDGSSGYTAARTALMSGSLQEVTSSYEPGISSFVFETGGPEGFYPCLLLPDPAPSLPPLQSETPAADESRLLSSLGLNPRTRSRYEESDGTQVIVEGNQLLRLHRNGVLEYTGGEQSPLSVRSGAVWAAAEDALTLMQRLAAPHSGDASLYLTSFRREGGTDVLTFGYQTGGVPIRFADGSDAGTLRVTGGRVSSLELRLRSYRRSEEDVLMLPLRQSAAIAAAQGAREISLSYVDSGETETAAGWVTD